MRHGLSRPIWFCIVLSTHALATLAETAPLEERLASASYWERMQAFKEVASVPPAEQPRYVPLLVDGLRDSDMEFRLAAVRALSGFGDNARPATPAMVETLEIHHGEARIQLIHDIARLGPLVVPALISALDAADPYVVWGVCETLAEIGAPARGAIPVLERLVDDSRPEVSHGARAAILVLRKE